MDQTSTAAGRTTLPPAKDEVLGRIDGWELVEAVSRGSISRVYRARPAGGPADRIGSYAVKILHPRWEQDAEAVDLFRRQATVSKQASHPHLVPILAAGVRRRPYYVVMPWLAGQTLEEKFAPGPSPGLGNLLWIVRQTAEALAALHASGWMHGDVKPDNIFVSALGHATLLDLGFARRAVRDRSDAGRPVTGTGHYMAPEVIGTALRSDIRSDIYSLGVVLYRSLTGRVPFDGPTLADVTSQHLSTRAPDLRRCAPHLPSGLVSLVREMLAKEPLRRPHTAEEVIQRLVPLEIATFAAPTAA